MGDYNFSGLENGREVLEFYNLHSRHLLTIQKVHDVFRIELNDLHYLTQEEVELLEMIAYYTCHQCETDVFFDYNKQIQDMIYSILDKLRINY